MRQVAPVGFLLGLIMAAIIVAHEGVGSIVHLLRQAGWLALLLVPLLQIATIREAITSLLPVANVGGEIAWCPPAWVCRRRE